MAALCTKSLASNATIDQYAMAPPGHIPIQVKKECLLEVKPATLEFMHRLLLHQNKTKFFFSMTSGTLKHIHKHILSLTFQTF